MLLVTKVRVLMTSARYPRLWQLIIVVSLAKSPIRITILGKNIQLRITGSNRAFQAGAVDHGVRCEGCSLLALKK